MQTANIRVTLFDRIDDVPGHDWLRFISEADPLLHPTYLRLLEDSQQGTMSFIYALVHQESSLIGICYFQVVRFLGTNLLPYFPAKNESTWRNWMIDMGKKLVGKVDLPLLVSGNLFITGEQGIHFLSHFTELEKAFYLSHTIDYIQKQRGIKTVLLPDMYEPSGDFDVPFLKGRYQRIYVEADMSMKLPASWHTFDDYLAAISSKYRIRAKKILQTSAQLQGHEMTADELESQIDRFFYLYQQVADKADFNIARFPISYYVAQKRLAPDMYKVFGYYLDGVLVGFMSLFILPGKTEVHYCGIDYSLNKEHNLYQRMLYDIVKYAIEHDLRDLHFGRTAPEVKSTLGAIPHPMYGYLRHSNPLINWFMGFFTGRLKPRHYVLRSPFK